MPSLLSPLSDFIVTRGSADQTIDLTKMFGGTGLKYSVTNSNGAVLATHIENGILTLDYGTTLDYSDLVITATDTAGTSVSDHVRVRVAGENAYTIAVLPDTQDYSYAEGAPTLAKMTQWLVDQKDGLNIQFVTHVGDVTAGATEQMWKNVTEALKTLDGKIPYSLTAGNHDQGSGGSANEHSTTWMDYYYSPEHQAEISDTFGGVYDMAPERAPNNYHTFTAPDGTGWLVLSLEFGPSDDVIRWAKGVIEDNLDKRVMLTTHAYMNWAGRHDSTGGPLYGEGAGYDYGLGQQPEGANDGETLYRELVQPYSNVTFTFSGHIFGDGAETLQSYDAFGNPVYQMMVNYQNGVANEIQHGNGGSGAIRLLTIDPENGQVYTTTYFALDDKYVSNDRGTELDRDGLTGPYRGQEETLELDVTAPELHAIAKAGNDIFFTQPEGQSGAAQVTLDGRAVNPGADAGLSYVWKDADGNVVATEAKPTLDLTAGRHHLTLTVTDSTGAASTDTLLVIVSNDNTLLVDNFNDGDTLGWGVAAGTTDPDVTHGTTADFGIGGIPKNPSPVITPTQPTTPTVPTPTTPDQPAVEVVLVPAAAQNQGLLLTPGLAGELLTSWSIGFDLMVPSETAKGFMSLIQSDLGNANDADMFMKLSGDKIAIGTNSNYTGAMTLDAWHRVFLTYEGHEDGSLTITKYIDGVSVGAQDISASSASRYMLDAQNGTLLFADEDGEVAPVAVSGITVTGTALSADQIADLGTTQVGGISLPTGVAGTKIVSSESGFKTHVGDGSLEPRGNFAVSPVTDVALGVRMPVAEATEMPTAVIPAGSGDVGLLLQSGLEADDGKVTSYSLAFDMLVPSATAAGYMSILQTSAESGGDADMFMKLSGGTFGIGTMGSYQGAITTDAWHRIVLTFDMTTDGLVISKYADGVLIGSQTAAVDYADIGRYALDVANGVLLFADDDGETAPVAVSAITVTQGAMTAEHVADLGGAQAGGIAVPAGMAGSQIVAGADGFTTVSGPATVATQGDITIDYTTDVALGMPVAGGTLPETPEDPETPETPVETVDAPVTKIGALSGSQMLHVTANQPIPAGTEVKEYSLVYDIYVPGEMGAWLSFLQTDIDNRSDGELFMNYAGGIGIGGDYEGVLTTNAWHRVSFTVSVTDDSALITKYIDGVKVGTTTSSADRFTIDASKGILLFSDNDGETRDVYASSVLFTDRIFSDAEIAQLGGTTAGGIVDTAPSDFSFQLDFSGDTITDTFGHANAEIGAIDSQSGNFVVKGSYADRVEGVSVEVDAEGRVYESSNTANNVLIWTDPAAQDWHNYRYEVTLQSTDKDTIGAVFYYKDAQNHYRVTFDGATNTRQLVRVENGTETVLASVHAGSPWARDAQLEIAVQDGSIRVFLDGQNVFGTVTDSAPLAGGTVGLYSSNQKSSQFDNVYVGNLELQAHAGSDLRVLDHDGDGTVAVSLDASGSYGDAAIAGVRWLDAQGKELATGAQAQINLDARGGQVITLEITDATGHVARDTMIVDAVAKDRILFSDDFSDADFTNRWTIVDEGEMNGVGANGTKGDWQVIDGRLVQLSDVSSRELTWTSADAADEWQKGWSPLGDGTNVLRKGTYALLSAEDAKSWTDYAVETTIQTPDNGALGLLVHYQDPNNYYKVELDAQSGNSLFQLIEVKDGVEKYLTQIPARYTPGTAFQLRVEVVDNTIQAFMDGNALFSYAIKGAGSDHGTVGLFSWGSAGLTFDTVSVVELNKATNIAPVAQDDKGFRIRMGEAVLIAAAALLLNDTDANADPLTITEVSADHGTAVIEADGNIRFTPETGFWGRANLTYTVSDHQGGTDTAVVAVLVAPEGGIIDAPATGGLVINDQAEDTMVIGSAADDRIMTGPGDTKIETGAGNDTVIGGAGDDVITAGAGNTELFGGQGNDTIIGGTGQNVLMGGAGNDTLIAGTGNAILFGGQGNDTLVGGAGDDWLTGGAGADTFVFAPKGGTDVVTDFTQGEDQIDLSAFDTLHDFTALAQAFEAIDGGTVVHLDDATSITLQGVDMTSLTADDFRFS